MKAKRAKRSEQSQAREAKRGKPSERSEANEARVLVNAKRNDAGSKGARTVGGLGGSAPQHADERPGLRFPQTQVARRSWSREPMLVGGGE